MSNLLTNQYESASDETNRTYGFEVFHDPAEGYYTTRLHIRTYDGIRVSDSYATGEVRLEAHTQGGAVTEARRMLAEFRDSLNPVLA